MPVLTPQMLIFGKANYLPEEEPSDIPDREMQKRAKYLRKCKDVLWKRWESEYIRALRERPVQWKDQFSSYIHLNCTAADARRCRS